MVGENNMLGMSAQFSWWKKVAGRGCRNMVVGKSLPEQRCRNMVGVKRLLEQGCLNMVVAETLPEHEQGCRTIWLAG
jgi:hypothetical protein